ncbi:unnamed protein product [Rotaria socialis]|uniref:VCBS repeat-containing protein n=1 Tax=Rotaria socialis TaxID=392032 RepID=A0A821AF39_9BILA|nr:unnamed protein product [Rotaria socialis]CAF4579513.1 unnamed protein product [Rotaria socialis]
MGSFKKQTTNSTGTDPTSVVVGDFNNDTLLDIVVANSNDNSVSVLLHYARGSFDKEMSYASGGGSRLRDVTANDFNNDTILDIVIVNYGTNSIGILLGYGHGSFKEQIAFSTGSNSNPCSIAMGDFNKDNHTDFAVASYGTKTVDNILGNVDGTFAFQIFYGSGFGLAAFVVAAGDFNSDG